MRPPPRQTAPRIEWTTLDLAVIDLCRWYFPGRGLAFSFAVHSAVLFLLLRLFPGVDRPEEIIPPWEIEGAGGGGELLIWLPSVGGGGSGGGGGKGSPGSSARAPRASGGPAKQGLVYPGPQLIRSDPPRPTNRFQTLLQPDLEGQPALSPPLKLPNLVALADASPPPRKPSPDDMIIPTAKPRRGSDKLSEEAALEAALAELGDLPIAAALPRPNLLARVETPALPAPVRAEPAVGLAKPDRPEQGDAPVPRKGAAVPARRETEDSTKQAAADVGRTPAQAADAPPKEVGGAVQPPPDPRVRGETPTEAVAAPLDVVPLEASKLVPAAKSTVLGHNARNVAALSPVPVWSGEPVVIPAGEARGRFTISPHSNLDPAENEPGSGLPAPPGATQGADLPSAVTISFEPDGGGSGGGTGGGRGAGSGTGTGPGEGAGSGSGGGTGGGSGAGAGPGPGPFEGITIVGGVDGAQASGGGSGVGSGSGGGSGAGVGPLAGVSVVGGAGSGAAGSGPGRSPLEGITTVGGVEGATAEPIPDERVGRPLRNRYELFVLSSEKSGGGLPYFGVFADEQIQTVYLDMRQKETEDAPLWTLEFAVPAESAAPAGGGEGFVLPVPAFKDRPEWPSGLASRHPGKMIVVYGVVNVEGRMESISILESPDPELNRPLIEALRRWVFRPGVLRGDPVPVKALLGVPLWSPPSPPRQ